MTYGELRQILFNVARDDDITVKELRLILFSFKHQEDEIDTSELALRTLAHYIDKHRKEGEND